MKEEQKNLLDFNWDDNTFFGKTVETTPETPKEKTPEEIEAEKLAEKKKEEEEEEVFFAKPEEEIETPAETKETPLEISDNYLEDVYKDFKDNGIFKHVELEDGEELDAGRFLELQEKEYEQEVSNRLNTWAQNDLDEDAQAFIRFKTQGGKTEDFFKTYQSSYEIPQGDISEEEYQDRVIRYQLKQEKWDADEIEDRLEYLTSSGKKEQVAKRYDAKIKAVNELEKEELLKQADLFKKQQQAQEEEFKSSLKQTLSSIEEVNGFKITQKDQTNLYNLMTRKQYKSGDRSVTGFQKKMNEVFQNPEKMILLAKLLDNDFDMSDFKKNTVTQQTRKIKTRLEQRQSLRPSNPGSSLGGQSLAEIFNK